MAFRFLGLVIKVFLLVGLPLSTSAQSFYNQSAEDTLFREIWRPLYMMPGAKPIDNKELKYNYLNFADLVRWQERGTAIRAIQINENVALRGGWVNLSKLPNLQLVEYNGDKSESIDSLIRVIAGLPVHFIVITSGYSGTQSNKLVVIPNGIKSLPRLAHLNLIGSIDLEKSLTALTPVQSLTHLQLNVANVPAGQPYHLPDALARLTQLRRLNLTGSARSIDNTQVIGSLKELRILSINEFGGSNLASKEERQAFSAALSTLTNLHDVSLSVDWLDPAFAPDWTRLQRLSLRGNEQKEPVAFTVGPMPILEKLSLQNVTLAGDFCSYSKLTQLSLGGNTLTHLPDCIGQLKDIHTLAITGSKLRTVPPAIGLLTSLTALSMSGASIDSLPDVFGTLTQLKTLDIYSTQLRTLPPSIGLARQLTRLNISNNKLTQLPDLLGKLSQLQSLNVSGNQLERLPEQLDNLKSLEVMIAAVNRIDKLPERIGQLRKLKILNMNKNALMSLPASIGSLDSLNELSLGNNKLTALPATIGNLRALKFLQVNENQLVQLPESIGGLSSLNSIQLYNNPLVSLPTSIGSLTAITDLNLHRTKIKMLPASIGQLRRLYSLQVSEGELLTLPAEISNCRELQRLTLYQIPLVGLPESIGRLQKLTQLTLGGQPNGMAKLIDLPDSIQFCSALTSVTISNFPNLSANEAASVLLKLPALEQLTMVQTPLSQLPADWKRSTVNTLQLYNNALTELPPGLLDAPKLRSISLHGNPFPQPVASTFQSIEQLRIAMAEAGWVTLENSPKSNWPVAQAYMQSAGRKAWIRDWAGLNADLEKALAYAPDTTVALVYAFRAELELTQKLYAKAIEDYDQALLNYPQLRLPVQQIGLLPVETSKKLRQATWWMRKAIARRSLGQIDTALSDINKASTLFPATQDATIDRILFQTEAQLFTEQGNTLALKNRFSESDSAFSRAMKAYETMPYPEPGNQLTVVELGIVTAQYNRARKALDRIYMRRGSYGTLVTYLTNALNVVEGKTTGPDAIKQLKTHITGESGRITNWSFDLFDAWLNRTSLPTDKRDALKELTTLVQERQLKLD